MKYLSTIRRIAAIAILSLFIFSFIDFKEIALPISKYLAKIQWVPAILSVSFIALSILLVMSLLFGRLYCSVLCPLGILQDVVSRISRRIRGKKKSRLSYEPPRTIIRYGIMGLVIISYLSGVTLLLLLLDPYGNFGRIASNIFRPLYLLANNGIAYILNNTGNYTLYNVEITTINLVSVIFAISIALIIGAFAWYRGRLYCNMICPVGSFLGFLSHASVFKIKINSDHCNQCGLCEMQCKSQCIDSKTETIDQSRCVTCFNCLNACKKQGIGYVPAWKKTKNRIKAVEKQDQYKIQSKERRQVLSSIGVLMLSIPLAKAQQLQNTEGLTPYKRKTPIAPPGAHSIGGLNRKCTGCQLCVTQCPSRILVPSTTEYGITNIMQPVVSYKHGFCNFNCTICTEVCPNNALEELTLEEKRTTQIGIAIFLKENCIVYRDETDCGACSEHCPTQAVKMVEYKDGLRIPEVTPDLCVGCGGCEYICPVLPYRAIYVEGNAIHKQSVKPEEEEQKQYDLDDFGF